MKRGEAQQLLIATNRWWRDPERWPAHDPDLRDAGGAPFRYQAGVLSKLTPGGLYTLRGPRRVGKTVEVKLTIRNLIAGGVEPRRIAHMAVDGLRNRDLGVLIDAAGSLMPEGVGGSGSSTRSPESPTAGRSESSGCATTTPASGPTRSC